MYKGSLHYTFTEQLASNIAVHGLVWTAKHCAKRGVPIEQLIVILKGAKMLSVVHSRHIN